VTIIVDTGVLLAAADADDDDHERCSRLLRDRRGELTVPAPVIPEGRSSATSGLPRRLASFASSPRERSRWSI
jgi:predicted nucleic acid-binding protein